MLAAAVDVGDELARFHATFQQTGPALDLGKLAQVTELLNQADDLASRLAQPHLTWLVSFSRAGLAIMLGELAQAEAEAERALTLGAGVGRRLEAKAFHAEQIAEIRRLQGRLGERRDSLHRASQAPRLDPTRSLLRYLVALDDDAAAPVLDRAITTYGLIPRRDPAERAALDNLAVAVCGLRRHDLVQDRSGRFHAVLKVAALVPGQPQSCGHVVEDRQGGEWVGLLDFQTRFPSALGL